MSTDDSADVATVASLIAAADGGDASAEALFTTLYQELRRVAQVLSGQSARATKSLC